MTDQKNIGRQTEKLREPKPVEGVNLEKLEELQAPKTIVLDDDEQRKFLHFGELDKAWQELLVHSQNDIAKQRKAINSEVNVFWKQISEKYNLATDKNYRINPETGEITETVFPTPAKGGKNV